MWIFSAITSTTALFKSKLGKVALVLIGIALIAFVINHEMQLREDLRVATADAAHWKKQLEDLQLNIKEIDEKKKATDTTLTDIRDDNIDLLCMARYGNTLTPPATYTPTEPTIVEVVKYKDRYVTIPSTTPDTIANPVTNNSTEVSDKVGVAVLNNSWKAYCAVTDNREDVCIPFR